LINLVSGTVPCDRLAETIAKYLKRPPAPIRAITTDEVRISRGAQPPKMVVRLVGSRAKEAKESLSITQAIVMDDLDEAIEQLVKLTKRRDT
jgi:succinyl-CoA synthetase beta subunit